MSDKKTLQTLAARGCGGVALALVLVFALPPINASAQIFAVLDSFNGVDGSGPMASLTQGPDGALYGTAGTVFKVQPDGSGFVQLYGFTNSIDGDSPVGGLVLSGDTLYGTTTGGGSNGFGTIFALQTDGSGFTNLYDFSDSSDGANPEAGLILSGNTLYGTALNGGSNGFGSVFSVNINGGNFKSLYGFTGHSDCGNPYAGLVLSNGTLYGTTTGMNAAIADYGTVFKINTDGSGYKTLVTFLGANGANPFGGLALSGGEAGYGTVFQINLGNMDFTTLYNFSPGDGDSPAAGLILSGSTLIGTTEFGGTYGEGAIFALSLGAIPLNTQTSGSNLVLSWGNPAFSLQASSDLNGAFTNIPGAASPYTNPTTGPKCSSG